LGAHPALILENPLLSPPSFAAKTGRFLMHGRKVDVSVSRERFTRLAL
jgi:hypothetical protein